jgi:hypothetical protein
MEEAEYTEDIEDTVSDQINNVTQTSVISPTVITDDIIQPATQTCSANVITDELKNHRTLLEQILDNQENFHTTITNVGSHMKELESSITTQGISITELEKECLF